MDSNNAAVAPRPTIYVTNWGLIRADNAREGRGERRLCSGPKGRHYTIMARPRAKYGECGDGRVVELMPAVEDLVAVRRGLLTLAHYRYRYERQFARWSLDRYGPRALFASANDGNDGHVAPNSTLACSCSAEAATEGKCHRVWAAGLLLGAGWRVVLDGRELAAVDSGGRPMWVSTEPAAATLPGMEG